MHRILFIFALLLPAPAYAQTADPLRLDEISRQQEEAQKREAELAKQHETIQAEISNLKRELVIAAAEAEGYEKAGRETEGRLKTLTQEEADLKSDLYADRKALMRLLAALQIVETNPPPALAIMPEDATDAARAARLMASLSKDLESRAEALSASLNELTELRETMSQERSSLALNEVDLEKRRLAVKKLVQEKADLEKSIAANREAELQRVASLAAEANDLRELIASFETATRGVAPRVKPEFGDPSVSTSTSPRIKPKSGTMSAELTLPPDSLRFADARGSLRSPVRGRVTESYGGSSKGITVAARSRAQVITPYNARVEFAGPFKNYDNVVILNVGEGYFILLTGIGDVYASTGAMVNAGEPLGLMPHNSANLYIEFRKDGSPINPTPWLGTAIAEAG